MAFLFVKAPFSLGIFLKWHCIGNPIYTPATYCLYKFTIMRFSNKVCIVTGAGSGIGRATAQRLAAEGGNVVVADRDEKGGNETVDLITKQNGSAIFIKCDVGDEAAIRATVEGTLAKWGKIDVVI